jgi:EAL domain-containing protein (putative c-di-GMP-specific phosphodiesterase class I)
MDSARPIPTFDLEPAPGERDGVDRILQVARQFLEMDVAFISEFVDGQQLYRAAAGDIASFGAELDTGPPLTESHCWRMVQGEIPNAVPDVAADPVLGTMGITAAAGVGAYVGVPLRLADGTLYGTLCAVSHEAQPVDARDAKVLTMLADLVVGDVEARRDRAAAHVRIRDLVDEGQVSVALQPIVDINTGRTLGVEALSRFPSEFGDPSRVFAAAHAVGLGQELEQLAAANAYALMPLLGRDQYLALNLSPDVALLLAYRGLNVPGIPLHQLVLEVTEHAAVENYAPLLHELAPLRERGLRVAVDDAGAGYASLNHIVELAPDIIKIDRCLVDGLSHDAGRRSVVSAFVTLAVDLGATVVAEGVEEMSDLDAVRDLGVGAAQGYLLARPSTDRGDLERWLTSSLCPDIDPPVARNAS